MKQGKYVAAGVAAGYLLGRTKKMKLALMVGALAVGQRADLMGLARKGTDLLQSAPGVQDLTGTVTGRLKDTGRAAAVTAAKRGVESLSGSLERRAERVRGGSADDDEQDRPDDEDEPRDEQVDDQADEEPGDEEPAEEKPRRRKSNGSGSRSTAKRGSSKSSAAKKSSSTKKKASSSRSRRTSDG